MLTNTEISDTLTSLKIEKSHNMDNRLRVNARETAYNSSNIYLENIFSEASTLDEYYDGLIRIQVERILKGKKARFQRNGQLESHERRIAGLEDSRTAEGVLELREQRQSMIGKRIAENLLIIRQKHKEVIPRIVKDLDDDYLVTCLLQGVMEKEPEEFADSVDFKKFGIIYSRYLSRYMRVAVFLHLINEKPEDAMALLRDEKLFHFPHLKYLPEEEKKKKITIASVTRELAPIIADLIPPEFEKYYPLLEDEIEECRPMKGKFKSRRGKYTLFNHYGIKWKKDKQVDVATLTAYYDTHKEDFLNAFHAVSNAFKAGSMMLPRKTKSLTSGKLKITNSQFAACMETINNYGYNQIIASFKANDGERVNVSQFAKELGYKAKIRVNGDLEISNSTGKTFMGTGKNIISSIDGFSFRNSSEYLPVMHHVLVKILRSSREIIGENAEIESSRDEQKDN